MSFQFNSTDFSFANIAPNNSASKPVAYPIFCEKPPKKVDCQVRKTSPNSNGTTRG